MRARGAGGAGAAAAAIAHSAERGGTEQPGDIKSIYQHSANDPQRPFRGKKFASEAPRALQIESEINCEQIHAASLCL